MLTKIGTAACDPRNRTDQLDALRGLIGQLGIEEPERVVRRMNAMCGALETTATDTDGGDG